ncbi:MAG: AlwI family type II restriction endonuclease [Elusimicrobiota bacterium]
MAKKGRTKEIWHIPKRGNVHQTIYMVYVLTWDKFLKKTWSSGKQESLGSEMGKAGLTESGKAITHQSVRTLLANLPKYLGFVYLDKSSSPARIVVTDIGYELIKKHRIDSIKKHKNLKAYKKAGDLIEISDVFKKQMSKLIITNPSILKDCENILVFPFRITLKLLLELDYLDKEEIAYILFQTKSEDEFPLLIEKIKNFRTLTPEKRTAEIEAYKKTEEGKLTLIKAPTAGYYMYLCFSTGLCERTRVKVNKKGNARLQALKLKNAAEVRELLKKFEGIEIYNFKDDWYLWKEYFSNPKRIYPPFDVVIKTNTPKEILVTVYKGDYIFGSDVIIRGKNSFKVPVFRNEKYKIIAHSLESGRKLIDNTVEFSGEEREFLIKIKDHKRTVKITRKDIVTKLKEMFTNKFSGFDKEYYLKLNTINKILGKNYFDNRRKGGRLEYLFFELLSTLKDENIIDDVYWYGKRSKYGICEPAPGGKEGNPDIVFEINNYLFVLELTTFRGSRAQWSSAEASSVPDHISRFNRENPTKKVVGIFSAPSIHRQLEKNLRLIAEKDKVGMKFEPCIEFSEFVVNVNRKQLLDRLTKNSNV